MSLFCYPLQICSLLRGGIAERGGVRVGHRIIEINGQSVVAVPHEKIVNLLATSVGEVSSKQESIASSDVETEDTLCSSEYQFTTLEDSELTEKESCSDAQTQIETNEPNTPVDKNEMVREKNKEETSNVEGERPTDEPQTLISSPVVSPMRGNITSLRFEICVQKSEF